MLLKNNEIDWKKTFWLNLRVIANVILVMGYLFICFRALFRIEFSEPVLRLPFIIIIGYSAIQLMEIGDTKIPLVKK